MRGRKRIISLIAILSVILIFSGVFASGLVDVSKISLLGQVEPLSPPGPITLFVDPVTYLNYSKTVGQTVQLHVNISGSADMNLFAWQLNVTWNKNILNASKILPGEFLNQTTSPDKTASHKLKTLGKPQMNKTDNVRGYSAFSDSILRDFPGINGSGRLATIEFLVVGYGSTDINISLTGTWKTTLLSRARADITPPPADVQKGYFRNKLPGDVDGDTDVDFDDFSLLRSWYTYPTGALTALYGYNRECDFEEDFDGTVDFDDFSLLRAFYTYPKGPRNPDP